MKSDRPVNLDLFAFRFPLTAITSIIHRITGVVLFLSLPLLLLLLDMSLQSSNGFSQAVWFISFLPTKLMLIGFMGALLFHLVAGIKHLLMDIGFAETKEGGKLASTIVLVVSAVLWLLAGVWIW